MSKFNSFEISSNNILPNILIIVYNDSVIYLH